jgi:asparagine synthase (glutamine-hydrolysing)
MSIIFGLLKERGARAAESEVLDLALATDRYATGASAVYTEGRLGMGIQPYFSHQRSTMENRPAKDADGNILGFDGRLDNYQELSERLGLGGPEIPDSQIVLSAFARWGEACFSHFVGDWAIALWSEKDQSLHLARDHAGTRTLYFRHEQQKVLWSTHLDTFSFTGVELRLAEDYVACYLASGPIRELTPYEGIRSVPPAHYLTIRNGALFRHAHWNSIVRSTIRYKSDAEYEAHCLALFKQSVERRTVAGAPTLAELSGGMDSTSIVCMSDHIRRSADPAAELLDTVSYYDDSEASLNERPYFSITEANRGKVGIHVDMAFSQRTFTPHEASEGLYYLPGADSFSIQQEHWFYDSVWQRGYRSILSGNGGDEVLGGVPIAFPELADYLVSGRLPTFLARSVAWSLVDRSPLIATLYNSVKYAAKIYRDSGSSDKAFPPWVSKRLRIRSREVGGENPMPHSRLGVAPHRLDNGLTWWSVMENLPHLWPRLLFRPEYRYPFLDKDLVEYLFSIPREQVLRPGRRRSLMRRALVDIVPPQILERRRKAFQLRAPLRVLEQAYPRLELLFRDSVLGDVGLVDIDALRRALSGVAGGESEGWQALIRTIALELWLKTNSFRSQHRFSRMEEARLHLRSTVEQRSSGSVCQGCTLAQNARKFEIGNEDQSNALHTT